jgi:hypothetical protein
MRYTSFIMKFLYEYANRKYIFFGLCVLAFFGVILFQSTNQRTKSDTEKQITKVAGEVQTRAEKFFTSPTDFVLTSPPEDSVRRFYAFLHDITPLDIEYINIYSASGSILFAHSEDSIKNTRTYTAPIKKALSGTLVYDIEESTDKSGMKQNRSMVYIPIYVQGSKTPDGVVAVFFKPGVYSMNTNVSLSDNIFAAKAGIVCLVVVIIIVVYLYFTKNKRAPLLVELPMREFIRPPHKRRLPTKQRTAQKK